MLKRLLFVALLAAASLAQAAVYSLPWGPKPQFVDANGAPMSSATVSFFAAGTTTPQNTFTDSSGGVANANPIMLNTRGETPNEVWFSSGASYKVVLKDSSGSTVWTVDNVSGVNDVTAQLGQEWVTSGLTPTFVSATSFTVTGDQTLVLHVGRRVKTVNSGGTVYSTIVSSAFAAVTTVTVANDSGTLDAGLSSLAYSVVSANNPSVSPEMVYRKGAAVASATTTNIWGIAGDFVHVTGTTTITSLGTAPYAGARRWVIFDGALTLTNGASLALPGAMNKQTAANDRALVIADTTANMIVLDYIPAAGTPIVGTSVPRSHLAGLTMSTAGSSATMTIAAGQAVDDTNAIVMNLASSISKTTSSFTVGTGNGCLDTGSIANTTWYHFYEIERTDTGVVDILCSTSASSPTMPSGYSFKRRIGSGRTNGSAQWIAFIQDGDYFRWLASVLDVNTTNPGNLAVSATLTVPTGVNVHAILISTRQDSAAAGGVYLSDLAASDEAAALTSGLRTYGNSIAGSQSGGTAVIRTNTSAQIRYRLDGADSNTTIRIATLGWFDRRGRDN